MYGSCTPTPPSWPGRAGRARRELEAPRGGGGRAGPDRPRIALRGRPPPARYGHPGRGAPSAACRARADPDRPVRNRGRWARCPACCGRCAMPSRLTPPPQPAPDKLGRQFDPDQPYMAWCGDLTVGGCHEREACRGRASTRTPHFAPDGRRRPAQTLGRTAVGGHLLARRKPGVQSPHLHPILDGQRRRWSSSCPGSVDGPHNGWRTSSRHGDGSARGWLGPAHPGRRGPAGRRPAQRRSCQHRLTGLAARVWPSC
jgi:hypothetical protein